MARFALVALASLLFVATVVADVYMHNPRGSNNRLNERSANRNNGNRMFDSQNNNRGGYNKGDIDTGAFDEYDEQFDMSYYMSDENAMPGVGESKLNIEWTNQHGCGGNEHGDPHKLNCNIVIQYMCVPEARVSGEDLHRDRTRKACNKECFKPRTDNPTCVVSDTLPPCTVYEWALTANECVNFAGGIWLDSRYNDVENCPKNGGAKHTEELWLRDGLNTNRQDFTNPNQNQLTEAQRFNRKNGNVKRDRGLHETWDWYDECYRRERNRGLFTADQNLRNNALGYSSAVYTRQNPNNNRRGYECPEERDYWPYWHPSPWVDIAVLTDRLDLCAFYQSESFNVKAKGYCRNTDTCRNCIRYNNEQKCVENEGRWVMHGAHDVAPPECIQAPWSRVNHLGNGRHGQANTYNWTLPYLEYRNVAQPHRCVVRLRYNISTDDYDAWRVNASFNNNNGQGVQSPVRQNPNVDMGAENQALRLAINTAQFGRTFQDRSHAFRLIPRTFNGATGTGTTAGQFFSPNGEPRNIYNINVRGKRGNIVQTFPSVEYDFVPNHLHITENDLVHFQWTGSNTHNNGNPAGDGQAGDAGEGTGGTDRHNVVELKRRNFGESFPSTWEENTMFTNMVDFVAVDDSVRATDTSVSVADLRVRWALRMATAGKINTPEEATDEDLNPTLNNAPASFRGGLFRFKTGEYNYMCTRNHNFSNRDQKGILIVDQPAPAV